ncbi:site-specific recombinase XerD (plasmid) [Mycolicibacterium chubuense NBB4]|uniref:Site-specific recombinase XerD n=1 Tax=Mycolicibacterium chubuense (strain NBB4) TaxID=710421 RepID=I4BTE8_MYCCN|nr:tyrosine-type recombinase/integrase [Mycolicibacterium chubuense]AFM20555.1 site-specific recombinase XerD [Mycolicibacterium chubuense NBB4]
MPRADSQQESPSIAHPAWFVDFLADRAIRKPSPHTAKAYRQDFDAIATLVAGTADGVVNLETTALNRDGLRAAFAVYAQTHSAASVRRCWSTWNTLCTYLFTADVLDANPMPLIGRPKVPKSLPKSYSGEAVTELVAAIDAEEGSARRSTWPERDRAIVFIALLAGLRAEELIGADIGDIRRTDDGGVLHVHGKGNKDRRIPFGTELLDVVEEYLETRLVRVPVARRRSPATDVLSRFSPTAPLFVGVDGARITRGTLQYRILRALKKAGINSERPPGALVHGLRHTFATELANANVSVYALMKLLGHESMVTAQRYVDGAATETRSAAESNPLYGLITAQSTPHGPTDDN